MKVSGQLHAPAALAPGKQSPGTYWKGPWVGKANLYLNMAYGTSFVQ